MGIVTDAGKQRYLGMNPICEFDPHFFLDVGIFGTPYDSHGRFKLRQICLKMILVMREMRIIVIK